MTKSLDSSKKVVASVEKTQHGVCFIFVRFSIRMEQCVISYSGHFTLQVTFMNLSKSVKLRIELVGLEGAH